MTLLKGQMGEKKIWLTLPVLAVVVVGAPKPKPERKEMFADSFKQEGFTGRI